MKELKISARQAGMIIVMLILANIILITPSVIFAEVGADGFFVVGLLYFLDLLVLGCFFVLKSRYKTESFYQILSQNLGKVVAKVIMALFLLFFLVKSLFTFAVAYTYLKMQVYQDEFEFLAIVCILPVINHAVLSGIRPISRTVELFFYIILSGVLLCIAMSFTNGFGLPIFFQTSAAKFCQSGFRHLFSFGDYLILFLIMDKIELKPKEGRRVLYFAFLGVTLVLAILFRFYSIYRITAFMHNSAIVDISMVSAEYSSLGRLDVISMITVMFLVYFQLELFTYGFCQSFVNVFPRLGKVHAVILFDILFFVLYILILSQYDVFINTTETYMPYVVIVINYLVPLLLAALSARGRAAGRHYEKVF